MSDTRKDKPDTREQRQIDRDDEIARQQAVIDAVAAIEWPASVPSNANAELEA